jgi:DNA-binding CsgD family transcriptional regulator
MTLTPREQTILELYQTGHRVQAIGPRLGISPNTVRVHLYNVKEKYDLASCRELRRT